MVLQDQPFKIAKNVCEHKKNWEVILIKFNQPKTLPPSP